MPGFTLFTDSRFPCPQRLRLVIHELGIDLDNVHEVDILKAEHKTPEYLALNTSGAVPCLRDDHESPPIYISESRAIARYLAHRYQGMREGSSSLVPSPNDYVAFAKFEEGASFEATAFDPAANKLVLEEYFKPRYFSSDADEAVAANLKAQLDRVFSILEKRLSSQTFMAGESLTVVDLFYMPYMFHLTRQVWPNCLDSRPCLKDWWQKMTQLDAYQAVLVESTSREGL